MSAIFQFLSPPVLAREMPTFLRSVYSRLCSLRSGLSLWSLFFPLSHLELQCAKMYLHLISFVLFIEPFLSPLDDYIFPSRCRGRFIIIWVKIQNDSVSFSGEQWGSACCISAQVSLFFPSSSTVSLRFLRMCFDVLCWLRSC